MIDEQACRPLALMRVLLGLRLQNVYNVASKSGVFCPLWLFNISMVQQLKKSSCFNRLGLSLTSKRSMYVGYSLIAALKIKEFKHGRN